jgi:cytochrome c
MRCMKLSLAVAALVAGTQLPSNAQPLKGNLASGRQIATAQCSSCHRVQPVQFFDKGDPSLADKNGPPSFQSIANLTSTTGLALNVFLHSNHKNMPNIMLSGSEADDVITYILSLKQ